MGLANRFRALFRSSKLESEIEEELRFHLEMRERTNVAAGMVPQDAHLDAHRRFGNSTLLKERMRDIDLLVFFETAIQDLRFGVRTLIQNRAVTIVAVLTLALGVGANTALFSLLNTLALRDLPVPHPEQLVRVGAHSPDDSFTALSLPMFEEFAGDQKVFSDMFAWWGDAVLNVETNGVLSRADIWAVTGSFHSQLAAVPEIGRALMPADVNLKAAPAQVAVLGYGFWQRHYGGARDVIGKVIKVEGVPFTVIGVTRQGFTGISAEAEPEITVPITAQPLFFGGPADVQKRLNRRDRRWLEAAGRLRPGVTLEQARAQFESLWPAIREAMAPLDRTPTEVSHFMALQLKVESGARGASFLRRQFTKSLYLLLAISGVVLLLTCVNIASLMLARAASRGHELGVRVALGASRARLVRQMLTESLTLSIAGALAGFGLALWGSSALAAFIVGQIFVVPAALNLSPDWRVFGFTASVAILTGVLFGMAPAWRAVNEDPHAAVQRGARTMASGTGFLGKALVIAQVALSIVLVTGAGLLIRTVQKLHAIQPGFRTHGALDARLYPKPGGYTNLARIDYYHMLTDRIAGLPGVAAAGLVHTRPASILPWTEKIRISKTGTEEIRANVEMLMPGALQAMGIGLLRGRGFSWQDDEHRPSVAIVSKNLEEKLFPKNGAIGQQLDITTLPKWQNLRIVGIVSNASLYDLRKHEPPTLYLPSTQYGDYMGWSDLFVQARISPMALTDAIQRTVESLGHEYVASTTTVEQEIDRSLYRERVTAILSAFFGGLALLLAAIGLYGLMAYNVSRRSREIAIRIAGGAQRAAVQRMVITETLALALIGVTVGVPCGVVSSKLIAGMLYGVSSHDPLTFLAVSLVLMTIAAIAGLVPARRAMRLDPIVALRCE